MRDETLPDSLAQLASRRWADLCERHPGASQWPPERQRQAATVLALSDFVCDNSLHHPDWLYKALMGAVPDPAAWADDVHRLLVGCTDDGAAGALLRRFRRQQGLTIAVHDLLGLWSVEQGLTAISALAEALIMGAAEWLYHQQVAVMGTPRSPDGEPQPLLVIGMGKLGGDELNFSSDVDLIFVYPERGETDGGRRSYDNQEFFSRLGQRLIQILDQRTGEGFVYRVDMRLRPFGASGPLVVTFAMLEDYYQEQGRDWERYAMIKGRLLGPRSRYHQELETMVRPFVYRRYLDFGAIKALRDMKAMIAREVRRRDMADNIKLGAGGIREIEFIAQVHQLIRGGRDPKLQCRNLLQTLTRLEAAGLFDHVAAGELRQAYLFLRRSEHVLQQIGDNQTQSLPDNPLDQARLAFAMGFESYPHYRQALDEVMAVVHRQFIAVIGEERESEDEVAGTFIDLWQADLQPAALAELWLQCGVAAEGALALANRLLSLRDSVRRRPMGNRGREALDRLMPRLLTHLPAYGEPARLLERLEQVLVKVVSRTAYLELMAEHPGVIQQLCRLCDASPWLADQIARHPLLLDELIDPAQLYAPPALSSYGPALREYLLRVDESDLEQVMEALRLFKQTALLRIAACDVAGALPLMKISDHLTWLAEALIHEGVRLAWQQTVERYGRPSGLAVDAYGFAVIAYGKLGGIELGYGSDLDLVLLHNCPAGDTQGGPKQIDNQQFYNRLAQRLMHLFTTRTVSGQLYEVDMRLRPSGESGLLVSPLARYGQYLHDEAWTWEHQALVRARLVYGDAELQQQFEATRQQVLCLPRPQLALAAVVAAMRLKMQRHLSKGSSASFDLKQDRGGIVDIEFLAQYLVLAHAAEHPNLTLWSDNVRIFEQVVAAGLMSASDGQAITRAYLALRNHTHRLALQGDANLIDVEQMVDERAVVSELWLRWLPDYLAADFQPVDVSGNVLRP